jgi:hypothetical protein
MYIYICICVMCVYVCIYMYTDMYVFSKFSIYSMCEFLSNRATCMREVDDKWTISYIYII